ncbi:MAG: hypothetical protein P8H31_08740 [Porticoccaceae bacterium]|nr:hypothetical protein [Porticoccaceae bacterium]
MKHNVGQAIHLWQIGFDTGQFYRDNSLWSDSIPHLGCAFETAEILLTNNHIEHELCCEWLTASGILLAGSFVKVNSNAQAEETIWMAINRLQKELVDSSQSNIWINRYLQQLYSQLNLVITANPVSNRQEREDKTSELIH